MAIELVTNCSDVTVGCHAGLKQSNYECNDRGIASWQNNVRFTYVICRVFIQYKSKLTIITFILRS